MLALILISLLAGLVIALSRMLVIKNRIQKELVISRKKAEKLDRLKSIFLRSVSYEIRTPLNAIIGFSNLILSPMEHGGEDNKYIVDKIQDSGVVLTRIIDDILILAKLETRDNILQCKDF